MSESRSERDVRISKVAELRAMGVNPYVQKFDKQQNIEQILSDYQKSKDTLRTVDDIIAASKSTISTAGRLTLYRSHGKLSFGKLLDESGEIQIMFHRDNCHLIGTKKDDGVQITINEDGSSFIITPDTAPKDGYPWHESKRGNADCIVKHRSEDKYLFLRRKKNGEWDMVGGGIDERETPEKAGCRELVEETGYTDFRSIGTLGSCQVSSFFHSGKEVNMTVDAYLCSIELLSDKQNIIPEDELAKHDMVRVEKDKVMDSLDKVYFKIMRGRFLYPGLNDKEIYERIVGNGSIDPYKFVEKYLDIGDFVGIKGELFTTKHGEPTIFVSDYQLLSKAIRPLGDKFHGIGDDQEKAYRQRYLDMIFNRETMDRMKLRSGFIRALREFYRSHDFMEIDCPVMTPSASGAAAKPFMTHHNDFDTDFYLRICNETELKKATIGGLERIFTIAINFRNEGSDPSHLQEFMMLEHQNVYKSYHEDMQFTEQMFDYIFDNLASGPAGLKLNRAILVKDKLGMIKEVDFTTPWPRIDYVEGVNEASGLDITSYSIDDADKLRADIRAKGFEFEGMDQMGTMTLIDYLYKKVLRPTIAGPAFIYNYPRIIAPLARISDDDPNKCEKRQVVVNGREIINSYGELVDPIAQKASFDEQSKAEEGGDSEATSADLEYVHAMEYGMPVQAGFGMGIDRIIALITQQDNLRDVVMFPLMKPENPGNKLEVTDNSGKDIQKNEINDNQIIINSSIDYPKIQLTQAQELASKYLTDTLRHCQQVAQVMKYFAQKLGHDEDYWYIVGLLHDVDWDHIGKDSGRHIKADFERIVGEIGLPQEAIDDIKSHGRWLTGVEVENRLVRQYLASVDELSGFLYAYSLMRPTGFEGMERKGINKRLKDKTFASGVDREHVKNCEQFLSISLEEFAMEVLEGLRS